MSLLPYPVKSVLPLVLSSEQWFRLKRKSGLLYTALYLKQCAVSLQRYYAGNYRKGDGLSVRIGLTRLGIPTIIPAVLRKHIRARSDRGDRLVRLYLSWFGVSKLIKVAPKVTKGTFSTISTPHRDIGSVKEVLGEIKDSFRELQPTYLPDLPFIPLTKGMTWEPTWKATPLVDRWVRRFNITIDPEKDRVMAALSKYSNIFANLKHEIAAFIWNINKIHSIPDGFFSPGILWFPRT